MRELTRGSGATLIYTYPLLYIYSLNVTQITSQGFLCCCYSLLSSIRHSPFLSEEYLWCITFLYLRLDMVWMCSDVKSSPWGRAQKPSFIFAYVALHWKCNKITQRTQISYKVEHYSVQCMVNATISGTWNVLPMIWKSWVWNPIGSNLSCVVLQS